MDNPTTLLVAIMYVTIVATGLINVLITLSEIVGRRLVFDPLHTGWIVLLLLVYLNFFWETTAILEIEGWDFLSFVSFIIGPIILLFATQLVLVPPDSSVQVDLAAYFLEQSGRFFLLLCLVQGWIIGLDALFGSFGMESYLTAATAIIFVGLMISQKYRVHVAGLLFVGLTFVTRTIWQVM